MTGDSTLHGLSSDFTSQIEWPRSSNVVERNQPKEWKSLCRGKPGGGVGKISCTVVTSEQPGKDRQQHYTDREDQQDKSDIVEMMNHTSTLCSKQTSHDH